MKITAILSLSCSFANNIDLLYAYNTIKEITKECLIQAKCKANVHIALGCYKFPENNHISLYTTPLIHIIITGKNISEFTNVFQEKITTFSEYDITISRTIKGNAFTLYNNRLLRKISLLDVRLKSNNKTPTTIKEISIRHISTSS